MRAKFIFEKRAKMSATRRSSLGVYPSWSGNKKYPGPIDMQLEFILRNYRYHGAERTLRDAINEIFRYLERNEGYHYGLSVEARNLSRRTNKNCIIEHAIPVYAMIREMRKHNIVTRQSLLNFLRDNYKVCLITREEDRRLNRILKSEMPERWKNWTDRYELADIELAVMPGKKERR